ncbi:MAG: UPF0236 family transposase-like protein [Bacillota bacterium]
MVQGTTQLSYEKATGQVSRYNKEIKVSKQTAANTVKDFQAKAMQSPSAKRKVDTLYIEADEDHINIKGLKREPLYECKCEVRKNLQ